MGIQKFYVAVEAAEYAAGKTSEWLSENEDVWDKKQLFGVFEVQDQECPFDPDEENVYYMADDNGAVGFTTDDGETVSWIVVPNHSGFRTQTYKAAGKFCQNCGQPVKAGWKFCKNCGHPLD